MNEGIAGRLRAAAISIVVVGIIFVAVFMLLSLEMSSPYTRESPDCSVWCVLQGKVERLFGL